MAISTARTCGSRRRHPVLSSSRSTGRMPDWPCPPLISPRSPRPRFACRRVRTSPPTGPSCASRGRRATTRTSSGLRTVGPCSVRWRSSRGMRTISPKHGQMPSCRTCTSTRRSWLGRSITSAGPSDRNRRAARRRSRANPDDRPADRVPVPAALRRGPRKHLPEDHAGARRRRRGGRCHRCQRTPHRPSTVRVEHDLYVLKQISGISMSLAGVLHAQGAAIVNPYPVTVAIRDKVIAARILGAAGAPMPATYVVSQPDLLTPLLSVGPLVVKPYDGTCGLGVRVVRNEAELFAEPRAAHKPPPILAQRYHPPEGRDLKIYVIGERLFGVRKVFPARTEAEKYGEPFTPTAEQADIALRCGRAFGIDLYGVDLIESDGQTYVVDMSSIPGFKGVPDAPLHLASYFRAAAERAANGRPVFEPPVAVSP